ncbi:MAG: glucokinase [Verrucomicrobiota bacterium]
MNIEWHKKSLSGGEIVLAGDVGGTNSNLALVECGENGFELIVETSVPSPQIDSLLPAISDTLREAQSELGEFKLLIACLSGAGPIEGNRCSLSNLSWDLDGDVIANVLKIPVRIINDFEAISYGVPLLDLDDPEQVTKVPHSDRSLPEPQGDARLVVGAGTGLGVSIMLGDGDGARALPSEGGHASFASFDHETEEVREYLERHGVTVVEIEDLLSGRGIASLLEFFLDVRRVLRDDVLDTIQRAAVAERPALVSKHAENHPVCRDIMRLFVKIYGRVAADMAATLLPKRGLFLAGGIVGKNEEFFLDGSQFVYFFEQNSRPQVQEILRQIPVYIIRNYSISLLGAANAGWIRRNG